MYQANQAKLPALGLLTCQCGREETRQQNESCRGSAVLWALVSVMTEWPRGYREEEPGRQRVGQGKVLRTGERWVRLAEPK